jgi:hypothetical protein
VRRTSLCVVVVLRGLLAAQTPDLGKGDVDGLVRAKRILERAQQAMGGTEKLAAVKDATHKMEVALEPAAGGYKMSQVSTFLVPDQIRQEQETPFGSKRYYSDGNSGWLGTPQGVQSMPPEVLKRAKGVIFRQLFTLMLSGREASRSVKAVSDHAVKISTADGQSVLIEFDPATGLPARQHYTESGANGSPAERVEIFSDWRDAGGIKIPYRAVQLENGVKMLELTISEYSLNTGITALALSLRPAKE